MHALVRASYLISNIEKRFEHGELSPADARELLQELSALVARLATRSEPSREGNEADAP